MRLELVGLMETGATGSPRGHGSPGVRTFCERQPAACVVRELLHRTYATNCEARNACRLYGLSAGLGAKQLSRDVSRVATAATAPSNAVPVCMLFYWPELTLHFFTAFAAECDALIAAGSPWLLETSSAF